MHDIVIEQSYVHTPLTLVPDLASHSLVSVLPACLDLQPSRDLFVPSATPRHASEHRRITAADVSILPAYLRRERL
jgi:hypothetical protein